MIDLYLICDPYRMAYVVLEPGGYTWTTMKSGATKFREDMAFALVEHAELKNCLTEYAGTLHPEPKKAKKSWRSTAKSSGPTTPSTHGAAAPR